MPVNPPRRRLRLTVEVDLDPVPGYLHEPDHWQQHLTTYLASMARHYRPTVAIDGVTHPDGVFTPSTRQQEGHTA